MLREYSYMTSRSGSSRTRGAHWHPEDDALQPFQKGERVVPMRQEDAATLTEARKEARLAWAKENIENEWYDHADLDEKCGSTSPPAAGSSKYLRLRRGRRRGSIRRDPWRSMVLTAVT